MIHRGEKRDGRGSEGWRGKLRSGFRYLGEKSFKVGRKRKILSFFFAFSTHTIRIWSQRIIANIILIGQYITATQHTYFNSVIINSFSNMPCSFYLPSFVFFCGFISGSALCMSALPCKGRYASRSPLGGKLAVIRNMEVSPCCSAHLYFIIPTIMTSPGVKLPHLPLSSSSLSALIMCYRRWFSVFQPAWHMKRDSRVAFDGISPVLHECVLEREFFTQHDMCILYLCFYTVWTTL